MKISYLGPRGTFTEQACIHYCKEAERVPCVTVNDALLSVEAGETDRCVAPVENSIEGTVNATIDALIFDRNLYVEKQLILPIEQNLMVKQGCGSDKIKKIISHPQALAQCRKYIDETYPGAQVESVSSTAEAARLASLSDGSIAGIGALLTAELYGLDIVGKNIQDADNNRTSFIVVTKTDTCAPKAGAVTSVVFSTYNKPGELYKILDIFSLWDINMIKIISRPKKDCPGEYVFLADIENANEGDVKDAIQMVGRKTNFLKILGTFPVEDYTKPQVPGK